MSLKTASLTPFLKMRKGKLTYPMPKLGHEEGSATKSKESEAKCKDKAVTKPAKS